MISDLVSHRSWGLIESQIHHLRSVIGAEDSACALSRELGVDLDALDRSERSILENAISEVQVRSKLWLLDELFKRVSSDHLAILVLGGWCGVLPWLAHLTGQGASAVWTSIDVDPKACSIGQRVFGGAILNLSFSCQDMHTLDYALLAQNRNFIVINTICEHLPSFSEWRAMMPKRTLTVLQSNNFRGCPDHTNCVDSIEELVASAGFRQVLFQGSLALSLFTRFMVVGRT